MVPDRRSAVKAALLQDEVDPGEIHLCEVRGGREGGTDLVFDVRAGPQNRRSQVVRHSVVCLMISARGRDHLHRES